VPSVISGKVVSKVISGILVLSSGAYECRDVLPSCQSLKRLGAGMGDGGRVWNSVSQSSRTLETKWLGEVLRPCGQCRGGRGEE
jgi:hypothetical protein